jgi:hypothetical protein
MWSICDEYAKIAEETYRYLFCNGHLDPSEAAVSLNHAVLRLREDPNITVDRWVLLVYFGV